VIATHHVVDDRVEDSHANAASGIDSSGTVLLLRQPGALTIDQQVRALVIFVAATASLVQYPFPAPIYFCYLAPLVALAAAAALTPHPVAGLLLVF
jgi:hypothetical protein